MSLPADFDLKERVRSAVDIVEVVGRDLELRPQGRQYVARCPFHQDRRPSLTVNQERQIWKCWVCDIGGDIFSFVMRRDGVDFPTALRTLAEQAGIPVEERGRGKKIKPGSPDDKATLLEAMRLVSDAYFKLLESGESDDAKLAREYLAERGISEESRRRFRIGFAPDEWSYAVDLLRQSHVSGEVAEAAGLALARRSGGHYDRFRGRLIFPIHDLQDRPLSLGGRLIPAISERDDRGDGRAAKYINGPETALFRKSHQLYGLQLARDSIRKAGEAIVMEGYTDVVAARQAGIAPVVAVLGTALGEEHLRILKRFADRVVLVLDGDEAGQRRADEVTELFVRADIDLRVLTLPEGNDPADYLAAHGRDAFDRLVSEAPDALDHKLGRLVDGVDVTRDTHRVTAAVDTMLGLIAKAPRGGGLRSDQLILRLARTFGLKAERLGQRLEALRGSDRSRSRRATAPPRRSPAGRVADPNALFDQSAEASGEFGEPPRRDGAGRVAAGAAATSGENADAETTLAAITGIDRELFETLIESPEVAAMAIESIDPQWLETAAAKMLLSAYQDLDLAGRSLDIESLLLVVENDQLKSQLVTFAERVRERSGHAMAGVEDRYTAIITRYRLREYSAEKDRQIARLETAGLPEEEELAVLKELFEAERSRMGIRSESAG